MNYLIPIAVVTTLFVQGELNAEHASYVGGLTVKPHELYDIENKSIAIKDFNDTYSYTQNGPLGNPNTVTAHYSIQLFANFNYVLLNKPLDAGPATIDITINFSTSGTLYADGVRKVYGLFPKRRIRKGMARREVDIVDGGCSLATSTIAVVKARATVSDSEIKLLDLPDPEFHNVKPNCNFTGSLVARLINSFVEKKQGTLKNEMNKVYQQNKAMITAEIQKPLDTINNHFKKVREDLIGTTGLDTIRITSVNNQLGEFLTLRGFERDSNLELPIRPYMSINSPIFTRVQESWLQNELNEKLAYWAFEETDVIPALLKNLCESKYMGFIICGKEPEKLLGGEPAEESEASYVTMIKVPGTNVYDRQNPPIKIDFGDETDNVFRIQFPICAAKSTGILLSKPLTNDQIKEDGNFHSCMQVCAAVTIEYKVNENSPQLLTFHSAKVENLFSKSIAGIGLGEYRAFDMVQPLKQALNKSLPPYYSLPVIPLPKIPMLAEQELVAGVTGVDINDGWFSISWDNGRKWKTKACHELLPEMESILGRPCVSRWQDTMGECLVYSAIPPAYSEEAPSFQYPHAKPGDKIGWRRCSPENALPAGL